eukprot:gnl/Hemi2/14220_TR4825_c0_g1_i1.p2 gnl/Hemi2/14220_TR4825_c0_g1~~gnl/Hemi2/14220_TR4825_c0_g1_i1.p2  ORF type:complete len:197 (-),score=52.22 gnl/Hemi2/14220_TR4825_c0_g1_i1:165-755(-)
MASRSVFQADKNRMAHGPVTSKNMHGQATKSYSRGVRIDNWMEDESRLGHKHQPVRLDDQTINRTDFKPRKPLGKPETALAPGVDSEVMLGHGTDLKQSSYITMYQLHHNQTVRPQDSIHPHFNHGRFTPNNPVLLQSQREVKVSAEANENRYGTIYRNSFVEKTANHTDNPNFRSTRSFTSATLDRPEFYTGLKR